MPRIKEHGFSKIFLVNQEFSEDFYRALGEVDICLF